MNLWKRKIIWYLILVFISIGNPPNAIKTLRYLDSEEFGVFIADTEPDFRVYGINYAVWILPPFKISVTAPLINLFDPHGFLQMF